MRRALASLLLAALNFPLIGGLLAAGSAPDLPECCRRSGRHHCAMMAQAEDSGGLGLAAAARCASWPKTEIPATNFHTAGPATRFRSQVLAQTRVAHYAVDFVFFGNSSDSTLQRGPPFRLS